MKVIYANKTQIIMRNPVRHAYKIKLYDIKRYEPIKIICYSKVTRRKWELDFPYSHIANKKELTISCDANGVLITAYESRPCKIAKFIKEVTANGLLQSRLRRSRRLPH
jgi:hypothetical protein